MKRAKSYQWQGLKESWNLIIENIDRVNHCNSHLNSLQKEKLEIRQRQLLPLKCTVILFHQIRHVGVFLHTCTRPPQTPRTPFEDSNVALTKIGITQANPTRQIKKESTQIRNKRTMQQQMTNKKAPLTRIIFVINNLPRAASH